MAHRRFATALFALGLAACSGAETASKHGKEETRNIGDVLATVQQQSRQLEDLRRRVGDLERELEKPLRSATQPSKPVVPASVREHEALSTRR